MGGTTPPYGVSDVAMLERVTLVTAVDVAEDVLQWTAAGSGLMKTKPRRRGRGNNSDLRPTLNCFSTNGLAQLALHCMRAPGWSACEPVPVPNFQRMHDQTASVSFTATAAKDEAVSADEAHNRGAAPDPAGPADLARELEMQGIAPGSTTSGRSTDFGRSSRGAWALWLAGGGRRPSRHDLDGDLYRPSRRDDKAVGRHFRVALLQSKSRQPAGMRILETDRRWRAPNLISTRK
jgi:hypothetical protein